VAGENAGLVWQREQASLNGVDDLTIVATGQVSAADAAFKERIACDQQLERGKVEADRALRVAGGVDDLGRVVFQTHARTVGQALVGRSDLGRCDSQPACLLIHHHEQRQVIFVQENRRAGKPLELESTTHMVDVGVSDEDLLELEAQIGEAAMDAADFVAGIDDDGFAGLFITEEGAVAGERADGKGLEDHGFSVQLAADSEQ